MMAHLTRLALLAALATPAIAHADDALLEKPRSRQGYYLSLGQQLAVARVVEEGDDLGTFVGHQTSFRVGQLLTPRLGLGLAVDFGGATSDPQRGTLFAIGVTGQAEVARDLAVHLGVGLGVITLDDTDDPSEVLRGVYAAAFSAGVTYDWFPWKRTSGGWALAPGFWLRAIPSPDVDAFVGLLGVEVTYWTGRPKNQLDLPPDQAWAP